MNKYALFFLLISSSADAFSVAPPPPPSVQDMAAATAVLRQQQSTLISSSVLPSQQDLLAASSSVVLSDATPATTAPPTKQNLATTGVAITGINYDGKVPTTEADEYVVVTNVNKQPVDVSGYYIYVATSGTQGNTFYFPKGSIIKPNQSVRIYTNEVHPETGGYNYGSKKALWNNRGGLAVMKDANGKKVCEFKYKGDA